jgi:hypothetical protein
MFCVAVKLSKEHLWAFISSDVPTNILKISRVDYFKTQRSINYLSRSQANQLMN